MYGECIWPKMKKLIIDNQPKDMFQKGELTHVFEERALLLAGESDIVILRDTLPNEYIEFIKSDSQFEVVILDSCSDLDDLSDVVLIDENLRTIKKIIKNTCAKQNIKLQAYIPDDTISQIASKLEIEVYGKKFFYDNHKKSIINQICTELGQNIIQFLYINNLDDLTSAKTLDFINKYRKIVIKPDVGLGGQFVSANNSSNAPNTIISTAFPAIIQEFLPAQIEGSIQFFKTSENWKTYFCETFQNRFKFCGYKYPYVGINCDQLELAAQSFLKYFIDKYADDIPSFGIDFIISNNKIYFHDINPRSTGVTYIFSLLHRLYGASMVDNIQCMYLQIKYDHLITYSELRRKIESYGLNHISKNVYEGFALLYPGMLKEKTLNILLVSKNNKIDKYRKLIYQMINQSPP